MNSLTFIRFVLLALGAAQVSLAAVSSRHLSHVPAIHRHRAVSRTANLTRRCKPRNPPKQEEEDEEPEPEPEPEPQSNNNAAQNESPSNESSGSGNVIHVSSDRCGGPRAVEQTTQTSGPNGHIDWLNCGIEGSGWSPPELRIDQIVTMDLNAAVQSSGSPFQACSEFIQIFNNYGNQFNIPPIMLASFAMQESSCRADTVGGAGEQGLMQITQDKCGGAPGGNCRDPDFNIRTGAQYFRDSLNRHGGNLLVALGGYNGWQTGMDLNEAQTMWNGNCRTQRNLDYLHQFLNGWCQNINVYSGGQRYGKYFNLDKCN